jgi:hypothetical protein
MRPGILRRAADRFRRDEARAAFKRWRPLLLASPYLFLIAFASVRLLESAADGHIRAPKWGGHASPSESLYWLYGAVYGGMLAIGILGLAGVRRRMKS